jgi:hypothetical protein
LTFKDKKDGKMKNNQEGEHFKGTEEHGVRGRKCHPWPKKHPDLC